MASLAFGAHKIKEILCLSIAPFREENCNAHLVSVQGSPAINSCADGGAEEMLCDVQGKSIL